MKKLGLLLLFLSLSQTGWTTEQARAIESLNLTGEAQVTIEMGASEDLVLKKGKGVKIQENNGVVTIQNDFWYENKDHNITLNSRKLKSLKALNVSDHVSLNMILKPTETTFEDLVINLNTSGDVLLEGIIGVDVLNQSGTGNATIYWVDQPKTVAVQTQAGHLTLAGEVAQMELKAYGDSFVDARYLRVRNVWVTGHDHANTKVMPLQALFASMNDSSILQAYNKPQVHSTTTRDEAAVTYPVKEHLKYTLIDPVVNKRDESLEEGVELIFGDQDQLFE